MIQYFILPLLLSACSSPAGLDTGPEGPWYSTTPETDFNYLPLGDKGYSVGIETWEHEKGAVAVDLYRPESEQSPVAVFLPGAFVDADRYAWVGHTLASHGVAVAIVQPPEDFARSYCTTGTLDWLATLDLDLGRVLLMGHSAGALTQAGLTNVAACTAGFCDDQAVTPPGLAGLALLGFHNESGSDVPMAAAEVPWLVVGGSRDGLATQDEVGATFERLHDRPVTWVDVQGMNHYQFTGYVDLEEDLLLDQDLEPQVANTDARATVATYLIRFAESVFSDDNSWEPSLDSDGDAAVAVAWKDATHPPYNEAGLYRVMTEPIADPGLDGSDDQVGVVAVHEFLEANWMIVRDDVNGGSVWRWDGEANLVGSTWDNPHLNALFGAMTEFQGELYVGLSSGFQGSDHGSTGAEVWATDGETWRPVMGPTVDADDLYTVQDCELLSDGSAEVTFDGDFDGLDLEGAFVDTNDHAEQVPLFLDVVAGDGNILSVTLDSNAAIEDEEVPCEDVMAAGTLALRLGSDEAGFGLPWNKAIIDMTVHGDRLYVATGLNYVHGPELWMSEDGVSFSRVVGGSVWGVGDDDLPLSTSITALLSWEDQLLIGTTGRTGYGARLLRMDSTGELTWLVDAAVDDDDVGLDEAGFGTGAQQVADLAFFDERIWLTTLNLDGLELFSTTDPDLGWDTVVGGQGVFEPGFGEADQFVARMWTVGDDLWLGSVAYAVMSSDLDDMSALAWRTRDGENWQLVSAHAFGINAPSLNGVFEQNGQLYGAAGFGGLANETSFGPLQLYSLTEVHP